MRNGIDYGLFYNRPRKQIGVGGVPPVGLGDGLSEFNSLVQSGDQSFNSAWNDVQKQIESEYPAGSGELQDAMLQAKTAMGNAYSGLAQLAGVDPGVIANKARDYVLLGKTIAGAVSTIEGLIQDMNNGTVTPAVVGSFIGTMVGLGIAFGVVSAGVGAAIVGAVGAIVALFQQFGLFQPGPSGGGNQQICTAGADGSDVYIGQNGPVYSSGSLQIDDSRYRLGYTIRCLAAYVVDPQHCRIEPSSYAWRHFPNPGNPNDSAWFKFGAAGGGNGSGQPDGVWQFGWGGTGNNVVIYSMGWSKPNDSNAFANLNIRPIDAAFTYWRYLECRMDQVQRGESQLGLSGNDQAMMLDFERAFFQAWKANEEYALNGLQPQDPGQVLINLVRLWNMAHNGPSITISQVDCPAFQGGCPDPLTPLYMNYVASAMSYLQNTDQALTDGNGNLVVNFGTRKNVPARISFTNRHGGINPVLLQAGVSAAPSGMSTGAKIAVGTAVVVGGTAAGIGIYALIKHQAYSTVAKALWRNTGGRVVDASKRGYRKLRRGR